MASAIDLRSDARSSSTAARALRDRWPGYLGATLAVACFVLLALRGRATDQPVTAARHATFTARATRIAMARAAEEEAREAADEAEAAVREAVLRQGGEYTPPPGTAYPTRSYAA